MHQKLNFGVALLHCIPACSDVAAYPSMLSSGGSLHYLPNVQLIRLIPHSWHRIMKWQHESKQPTSQRLDLLQVLDGVSWCSGASSEQDSMLLPHPKMVPLFYHYFQNPNMVPLFYHFPDLCIRSKVFDPA